MKRNTLYNERCEDTMSRMPDGFIDLTVTSPPYDNLRTYKNGIDKTWCADVWKPIIKELYRVTKDGGVVVWVVGDKTHKGCESCTSFRQALDFVDIGFRLNDTMIFQKTNPMPTENSCRYGQVFEYMFVFSKGRVKTFNPITERSKTKRKYKSNYGRKNDYMVSSTGASRTTSSHKVKGNVFTYAISMGGASKDKIAFKHPAIFPEKLASDHIISWSNEGDVIYDPFAGSGTVGKMAIINKRDYILSELSGEYCEDIIKPRLAETQKKIKEMLPL